MNTKKQKLNIEYPLATKSANIVWEQISTAHGLERWLADHVEELEDDIISLTWGEPWTDHHTLEAKILERRKNDCIRLQWVNEEDPDAYWEMSIGKSDLTDELCLYVEDFALPEDIDDLHDLWDGNMERLHQFSGL
ncbi:MAG: hypothetical protein IJR56_09150 [Bacteroidaceae bacterium]|nr:hypothetical protein [Bacteroidaceae bacterium]